MRPRLPMALTSVMAEHIMAGPVSTMEPTMGTPATTVVPVARPTGTTAPVTPMGRAVALPAGIVAQGVQQDGAEAPPTGMMGRVMSADIAAAPLPGAAVLAAQPDGEAARPLGVEAPALTMARMDARARGGGEGIFRAG